MGTDYTEIFNSRGHLYNEAGSSCPLARENERATLINLLGNCSGKRVVDIPAGGGYLADGICNRHGDTAHIICVEPAPRFASSINPAFEIRHDPMEHLSLEDGSIDVLGSLAGLHHIEDREPVYAEWRRVLKPGSRLAVADVMAGTGPASFLNEFVDAWSPGGHEGLFFVKGEFASALGKQDFQDITEELIPVNWCFPDVAIMVGFCSKLFATSLATPEQMLAGIEEHLGWQQTPAGVEMNWSLLFAAGIRS